MFILKVVHRQTLLRLFLRQEAPINFVNGSMMESMETQYATANQMNVTKLKLLRVGYKMGESVSFTSLFFFTVLSFHKTFLGDHYLKHRRTLEHILVCV